MSADTWESISGRVAVMNFVPTSWENEDYINLLKTGINLDYTHTHTQRYMCDHSVRTSPIKLRASITNSYHLNAAYFKHYTVKAQRVKSGGTYTYNCGLKRPSTLLTSNLNWAHKMAHSPATKQTNRLGSIRPCAWTVRFGDLQIRHDW